MMHIGANNWFGQIPEETTQRSTKLMRLNYSRLKIFKLKTYSSSLSLFGHAFLCPCAHSTEYVFRGFEVSKTHDFLTPRQPRCRYGKITILKIGVPKKISGYGPDWSYQKELKEDLIYNIDVINRTGF